MRKNTQKIRIRKSFFLNRYEEWITLNFSIGGGRVNLKLLKLLEPLKPLKLFYKQCEHRLSGRGRPRSHLWTIRHLLREGFFQNTPLEG